MMEVFLQLIISSAISLGLAPIVVLSLIKGDFLSNIQVGPLMGYEIIFFFGGLLSFIIGAAIGGFLGLRRTRSRGDVIVSTAGAMIGGLVIMVFVVTIIPRPPLPLALLPALGSIIALRLQKI